MKIDDAGRLSSSAALASSLAHSEGPKTLSVPEAGRRYFDLAKNASYEAARRGELPVIRIGRKLRVPIVALERMLEGAGRD
jgi:hypothetical protein